MRTVTLAAVALAYACGSSSPEVAPPPAPATAPVAARAPRPSLAATRDGDPRGREVVAGVPEGRPAARGRAPGDRRAQRPRGVRGAHPAAGDELRPALGRGVAHGGAARGGWPRAEPGLRR